MSDRISFNECAKKSREQKVTLNENMTFMSCWYVQRCFRHVESARVNNCTRVSVTTVLQKLEES